MDILLATINAKYFHASLGLRYLLANLGDLQPRAAIREFILSHRPADIAEQLLAARPRIIGLGVYIWNAQETAQVVAIVKAVSPETIVILGGPEVSYETEGQAITALADYVITGAADLAFRDLCRALLAGDVPPDRIVHAPDVALAELQLPYALYTDEDIAHRLIYVEASRGCPFKCQFCLSSLDKTAVPFDLTRFLEAMADLHARGVRHFKFVDRTFNLSAKTAVAILEFFLARLDERLFLHFELIPDRLPDAVRALLPLFAPGTLQLEIGIQTFNPRVQALIDRKQDDALTQANLHWLRTQTHAHIHADLIVGLPDEDLASFGAGFDRLIALDPQEIQVGVLKRLRGTPIIQHTQTHALRFAPVPPYAVLSTSVLSFVEVQRLSRFARYFDLIGNSGRFPRARHLLLGDAPFARFLAFADWLHATTQQTHQIAFERLFELLFRGLTQALAVDVETARAALAQDYRQSGLRGAPAFLAPPAATVSRAAVSDRRARQGHHLRAAAADDPTSPA